MFRKCLMPLKWLLRNILIIVSGRSSLNKALKIGSEQGLDNVVSYLETRFYKTRTTHFAISLYRYLAKIEHHPLTKTPNKDNLIIHFCCWGASYTQKAMHYLLPSLNAEGNVPYLSKHYHIVLFIHCDQKAKIELESSPVLQSMSRHATIQFYILPNQLIRHYERSINVPRVYGFKRWAQINQSNKYLFLGGLQEDVLNYAIKKHAYVSFMMPDFLLSNAFFKSAFHQIEGKKFVATTAFRSDYALAKSNIASYTTKLSANALSIPSDELVALQLKSMHPEAKNRIVSHTNVGFLPSAQLIFEDRYGFIIRAFHYHPVLLNCKLIQKKIRWTFMPIDLCFLNSVVDSNDAYEKQCWVCDDASVMSLMELSDIAIEKPIISKKQHGLDAILHDILKMIANDPSVYTHPLNDYFVSIRHKLFSTTPVHDNPGVDDVAFFNHLFNRE